MQAAAKTSSAANGPGRRWWLRTLVALGMCGLMVALLPTLAWRWLNDSNAGAQWLLAQVPGLKAEGVRGSLASGLEVDQWRWQSAEPGTPGRMGLSARGLVAAPVRPSIEWRRIGASAWKTRRPDGLSGSGSADHTGSPPWLSITLASLQIQTLAIERQGSDQAVVLPLALRVPVALSLPALSIAALTSSDLPGPVEGVKASLDLSAEAGGRHRLVLNSARWQAHDWQADIKLGADAPLPLSASGRAAPVGQPLPPSALGRDATGAAEATEAPSTQALATQMAAHFDVQGPLRQLALRIDASAASQRLSVQGELTLESAWPVPMLKVQVDEFDVSAWIKGAPRTALTGSVQVQPQPANSPRTQTAKPSGGVPALVAQIDLLNKAPAAWSSGGIPIARARGNASVPRPGTLSGLALRDLDLMLAGDGGQPAGQLLGELTFPAGAQQAASPGTLGGAQEGALSSRWRLAAIQTQLLDRRAPAIQWSGRLDVQARVPALVGPTPPARSRQTVRWQHIAAELDLTGRVVSSGVSASAATGTTVPPSGQTVGLTGSVQASPRRIEVARLFASAGSARAELQGALDVTDDIDAAAWRAPAKIAWRSEGRVRLSEWDPGLWWPGWVQAIATAAGAATAATAAGDAGRAGVAAQVGGSRASAASSPAASGATRLNALTQWRISSAGSSTQRPSPWQGLSGETTLSMAPSTLLGVPLTGDAALRRADLQSPMALNLQVQAASNRMRAEAQLVTPLDTRPGASPATAAVAAGASTDRVSASMEAPSLATVRSWWAFLPASAAGLPALSGSITGQLQLEGRWPLMRTSGELDTQQLVVGSWRAQRASARWQASPQADAPLRLSLDVSDAAQADRRIDRLQAEVDGRWAEHRWSADVWARATPPVWLRKLAGEREQPSADERSRWTLQGMGRWLPGPGGPWQELLDAAGASVAAPVATPVATPSATPSTSSDVIALIDPALRALAAGQATHWRAQWQRAEVQRTSARAAAATGGSAARTDGTGLWMQLQPTAVEVSLAGHDERGMPQPLQVRLGPGRLSAFGFSGQWDQAAWRDALGSTPPGYAVQARVDPVAVASLLQRWQPGFGWRGDLKIDGRLQWRSEPRMELDLHLARASGDLSVGDAPLTDVPAASQAGAPAAATGQALGLTALRVSATAREGQWQLQAEAAGQRLGSAKFDGQLQTAPSALLPDEQATVRGRLQAAVSDLGVWASWLPAGWRLGGTLRTELDVAGRLGAPQLRGELQADQIAVRNALQGVDVREGQLRMSLSGDRARIESARAKAGAGDVALTGTASLGEKPTAELALKADKAQVLGRVDRRLITSGDARVRLTDQLMRVEGRFKVDEGLFDFSRSDAPSLSDDVVITQSPDDPSRTDAGAGRTPPPEAQGSPRAHEIDLRIDLGERLRVRGRGLDSGLRGDVRLTTPNNRLRLNGIVQTVEGTYAAYGQRLGIDRGNLSFTGPPDNPRLDIEATRPNLDVRVGVAITGLAQAPRARLFSEPEMSEIEKLSWLMLGRPSDGLGRNDLALLQRAALALLAGEDGGSQNPVNSILGLDDLSVSERTSGDTRDTVVSLGKQLHRRWYLGYERSLNATAGTWQLIYRLAQRFTLRAQSGADNSVDIIWTWRWN